MPKPTRVLSASSTSGAVGGSEQVVKREQVLLCHCNDRLRGVGVIQ